MLTDYSKYDAYICNIVTLLLILLLLNIMSTFFQGKNELKANVIGQILYKEILKTCLFMDYEELQKKQTQEKMKTATLAFNKRIQSYYFICCNNKWNNRNRRVFKYLFVSYFLWDYSCELLYLKKCKSKTI